MTLIKLIAVLKKESILEQNETVFEKERLIINESFLLKLWYTGHISFQNTSKRKSRKEKTSSSRMKKRLKFPDT